MGKKQKKKQRNIRNMQRAGASKQHSPSSITSPGTMSPVPTSDDSASPPKGDGCCPHVERGVKLEKLRSRFSTKPPSQCQACTRSRPSRPAKPGAKNELWICLACGHVGCGWGTHANNDATDPKWSHAKTHRNQWQHPVVTQWGDSWDCWCLQCNTQLKYHHPDGDDEATSKPRLLLQQAAAVLQESLSGHSSSSAVVASKVESDVVEVVAVDEEGDASPAPPFSTTEGDHPVHRSVHRTSRRVIKGLMNLGNTCFFNSVMQNLVGVSMLREHFGREASLPEGLLKAALRKFFQEMDPPTETILFPGDGSQSSGSSMTVAAHTRSTTLSGGGSVGSAVSPRGLFSAICTKAPRFKGFQQQDSHELLRCLLDGLHMEEESMRKSAQPAQSAQSAQSVQSVAAATEPAAESNGEVEEENPKKVVPPVETFVEHMFGGQLSSTVSCCECGHSSVVYEPYLDLSLPIPSKQERSMGRGVESIRDQLPKLIVQRSQQQQRGIINSSSGNGVLSSVNKSAAPSDSGLVDNNNSNNKPTAMAEDPKMSLSRKAPNVLGCSSVVGPLSVLDGGAAVNCEPLNDAEKLGSMTGDNKDHENSLTSTSFPCEVVPQGAGFTEKLEGWLDFLDVEPLQGVSVFDESAGSCHAMSFLDQRVDDDSHTILATTTTTVSTDAPESDTQSSREVEGDSLQGGLLISTSRVEETVENSSRGGDMFSMQGDGDAPLEDGNQMEEDGTTIEYGPQLPAEPKQECLDLVLFLPSVPDVSHLTSEVKDQTTLDDSPLAGEDSSLLGPIAPAKNKLQSSSRGSGGEEDDGGDFDGVAGLFDDDTASEHQPGTTQNHDASSSSSFSNFDSVGTMPGCDLGPVSAGDGGGRAVVREVETYPIMSLEGCLQAFTKTEVLSGENAWGCENCTRVAHELLLLREQQPDQQSAVLEETPMDTTTNCSKKQLPAETDEHSSKTVGDNNNNNNSNNNHNDSNNNNNNALNAIHGVLEAEADSMQGEWESLALEDRLMEDLSTSTHSLSIVVVPQARDHVSAATPEQQQNNGDRVMESSTHEIVDDDQGSAGTAEASTVEDTLSRKLHNTLKRSQSLACFDESASVSVGAAKAADLQLSSSSKEDGGMEEPYVMVEAPSCGPTVDAVEGGRRHQNNNVGSAGSSAKETKVGRSGKLAAKDGAKKLEKQEAPKMVTVKKDATKRFLISKAPRVLTVHLKRFAQDMHGRLSKLSGHITFHEQLDLGPFIDQRDGVKRDGVYQLIGTVEHSGTMRGGHYVAYVKGGDKTGETDAENSTDGASTWYYISDSHVRKTSLESVLQSEAYLLFYERQTFE